jgi:hypothetical protein
MRAGFYHGPSPNANLPVCGRVNLPWPPGHFRRTNCLHATPYPLSSPNLPLSFRLGTPRGRGRVEPMANPLEKLTERERDVMALAAEGLGTKGIAGRWSRRASRGLRSSTSRTSTRSWMSTRERNWPRYGSVTAGPLRHAARSTGTPVKAMKMRPAERTARSRDRSSCVCISRSDYHAWGMDAASSVGIPSRGGRRAQQQFGAAQSWAANGPRQGSSRRTGR